ncbi:MAG TPA: UDP-N-acetylmuramate--L-alanine ligase [Chitinophagaceae bacterium]|jgi:UDP-N-acetylmuramate--alanine ligase|nr:UDP-N-acetylmuramate--L-alanine ligase [Chitinophagaceae bacterium]
MAELKHIQNLYFIGIGGIGMSALARYFRFQGKRVSGYDKTETALTKALVEEGIPVSYTDDPAVIPKDVQLVIYTPAIPNDHRELNYYRDHGYELMKRSEVLGLITAGSLNVCVAGTHGKTTISTMIAHILRDSGIGSNAFLGGISANYNTNFWSHPNNICVVEADEYDRSFLNLHPDIAVISSMDADHLDIYGTGEAVKEAFIAFSEKIKSGGTLVKKHGLPVPPPAGDIRQLSYHLTDHNADVYTKNLRIRSGHYVFDVEGKQGKLQDVQLNVGGWHNVENALAAITACRKLGLGGEKIIPALHNFRGVRRRFDYHVQGTGPVYIDDYAHHPRELEVLISSVRELFPDRKMLVVFQPHLFSRTRDFADGFAKILDKADEVILLPVYPARELPISGISSATILNKMEKVQAKILDKPEVLARARSIQPGEKMVLITAGAGDIDDLVQPLTEILKTK